MNYAAAIPEADFFDERGNFKDYRPPQMGSMNILRKVHNPSNATILSEDGVEISTSTSDPVPVSVLLQISPLQNFHPWK